MNVAANKLMKALVHSSLNARMQIYVNKSDLSLIEGVKDPIEDCYDLEMSIIMLWGFLGSVTLKLYFNIDKAIKLTANSLNIPVSEVDPQIARSFIAEFSNNQGGYLKGFLEKSEILTSMSLPMLAHGSDEATFRKIRDPRTHADQCSILIDGMEFIFTSEICLLNPEGVLAKAIPIQQEIDSNLLLLNRGNSGGIKFL